MVQPSANMGSESLSTPNALLGLEYIRAALKYYPNLEYIPIQRTSDHHNYNFDQELPSGTALRQLITTANPLDMCSNASKYYSNTNSR